MRVRVVIECDKIPGLFHNRIYSLIKTAVSKINKDYLQVLSDNNKPKSFCWSLNFDKTLYREEILKSKDKEILSTVFYQPKKHISLFISSFDDEFMFNLIEGLKELSVFDFTSNEGFTVNNEKLLLKIRNIFVAREKEITENEQSFIIRSSIVIENKEDKPVLPSDQNYNECFSNTIKKMYYLLLNEDISQEEIIFEDIKTRKQTIKLLIPRSSVDYICYTGILGEFKVKADPKILNFIYKNGLGIKNAYGLGMIDVI
jgi:CRISPR-associated endoribonuclease Cas6